MSAYSASAGKWELLTSDVGRVSDLLGVMQVVGGDRGSR